MYEYLVYLAKPSLAFYTVKTRRPTSASDENEDDTWTKFHSPLTLFFFDVAINSATTKNHECSQKWTVNPINHTLCRYGLVKCIYCIAFSRIYYKDMHKHTRILHTRTYVYITTHNKVYLTVQVYTLCLLTNTNVSKAKKN